MRRWADNCRVSRVVGLPSWVGLFEIGVKPRVLMSVLQLAHLHSILFIFLFARQSIVIILWGVRTKRNGRKVVNFKFSVFAQGRVVRLKSVVDVYGCAHRARRQMGTGSRYCYLHHWTTRAVTRTFSFLDKQLWLWLWFFAHGPAARSTLPPVTVPTCITHRGCG